MNRPAPFFALPALLGILVLGCSGEPPVVSGEGATAPVSAPAGPPAPAGPGPAAPAEPSPPAEEDAGEAAPAPSTALPRINYFVISDT